MNKTEKEIIEKVVLGENETTISAGVAKQKNTAEPARNGESTQMVASGMPNTKNDAQDKGHTNKKSGIVVLIIGIATLVCGAVILLINLLAKPGMRDAEFLVEVGQWTREDATSVEWNFTEIGKGVLTTNDHANEYGFIWAIDGNKIKIETSWLYELNDEYEYVIDQEAGTLTLKSDEREIKFIADSQDTVNDTAK